MKKVLYITTALLIALFTSCSSEAEDSGLSKDASSGSPSDSSGGDGGGNGGNSQAGIVTAGEWNDLYNWDFWTNLMNEETYSGKQEYWGFYTKNRVSISVENNKTAVVNAKVELKKDDTTIWSTKTDNFGKAELWIGLVQESTIDISTYSLFVNDTKIDAPLKLYKDGINTVELTSNTPKSDRVELSFIVDATGSMSDEINFLKDDLLDVIQKVKAKDENLNIYTSSVFYRDSGEDYVVKHSDFTNDVNSTINYIKQQSANGGGDYPEAVHSGLDRAINELQWSNTARTRLAFLILDAPPHYNTPVVESIKSSIKNAAEKGIKLIPVAASGVNKETEFLLRFFSISTNGTYVFITNDSGVGNDHIEATVGDYQVEKLNDLMVRLITKYSE